jgi:putative ABC transport system permease protein
VESLELPAGQNERNALRLSATPGYFAALGIDVVAGRPFADVDDPRAQPVAIVSELFAQAFRLQPADIVGRRINVAFGERRWAEVIGVVRDVKMRGPESDWQPAIYVPFAQTPINATGYVVAKAGTRPEELIPAIRMVAARIDPSLPLYNIRTFDKLRADYLVGRRFAMTTMVAFGGVALGLSSLGLYGVISYLVRVRTREIGIRMALGASPAGVRREVMASGAVHAVAGIVIGVTSALALWTLVSTYVPGLGQVDAGTVAALSGVVFAVSVSASWLPARRAARVDPLVALRYE